MKKKPKTAAEFAAGKKAKAAAAGQGAPGGVSLEQQMAASGETGTLAASSETATATSEWRELWSEGGHRYFFNTKTKGSSCPSVTAVLPSFSPNKACIAAG